MLKLSELTDLHAELDQMFFDHQCRLIHFDVPGALSSLECYEAALLTHMRDEEQVLFPVYAERGTPVKGGDVKLFLYEHSKMTGFVEVLKQEVAKLAGAADPEAKLIWLLDREAFYKRLCGHHDKRESEILYPELDRVTSDLEKQDLLGRVTRSLTGTKAAELTV